MIRLRVLFVYQKGHNLKLQERFWNLGTSEICSSIEIGGSKSHRNCCGKGRMERPGKGNRTKRLESNQQHSPPFIGFST